MCRTCLALCPRRRPRNAPPATRLPPTAFRCASNCRRIATPAFGPTIPSNANGSSILATSMRPCRPPARSATTRCKSRRRGASCRMRLPTARRSNANAGSPPASRKANCRPAIRSRRRRYKEFAMPGIDESRQFVPLKIAVLTVSDTRELGDDKSGNTWVERIRAAGHVVAERAIVKDDVKAIRQHVKAWIADKFIDVVISTGGTGFTGRDVTPEAVEPLLEKKMDGFATMFLLVSEKKIGTSAIQTRATAGVANATYIFCLPGSPGACKDAWDEILLHQLDYRCRPCNFVEILPRLDEHMRRGKLKSAKA